MSRIRILKSLLKKSRRAKSSKEKFRTDVHGVARGSKGSVLFPEHITPSRGIKPMGPRPKPKTVRDIPVKDLPRRLRQMEKTQLPTSELLRRIDQVNIQSALDKAKLSAKAKKPAYKSLRRRRRK